MLRYQLNPHFLFNTLNSISTLVLLKQTDRANAMLSRLSSFLRYTLVNEPMGSVTVAQEVETLKLYRSEEHTSELQSLMRISYAVFCLKKKNATELQHTPRGAVNTKMMRNKEQKQSQ